MEINPDDISFFWKGFSSTLPDYISETLQNLYKMQNLDKSEMERMFNKSKEWHLSDLKGAQQVKSYR